MFGTVGTLIMRPSNSASKWNFKNELFLILHMGTLVSTVALRFQLQTTGMLQWRNYDNKLGSPHNVFTFSLFIATK